MKKIYMLIGVLAGIVLMQKANAQCNGVKGPNLLGAKGTFSTPAVSPNLSAATCTQNGTATYSPANNVASALTGCTSGTGSMIPCSDYTYTSASGGLGPEGRYSLLKTIGDANGGNCIKGDWRGADHTGDGGYFMAVNGAPNNTVSPIFYKIKTIPVCIGATYEFSAWVINLLPATSGSAGAGSEPNISFRVNGTVIGTSGPIAYNNTPTWVRVSGSFVATTSTVDLEVINATAVASGNDLGLDDISIQLCGSNIAVGQPYVPGGSTSFCEGANISVDFTVTDATASNSWYQWQVSTNGGASFTNVGAPAQATFTGTSYTLTRNIGIVTTAMNGYKYRLVVATSQAGLSNAGCGFFNEFTLVVPTCGPLPVSLVSFNGKYNNGTSTLDWQTSQEVNNKEFQLLRSLDGNKFEVIATIAGAGNSSVMKNYQYQDRISGQGYVYYRLRQVDIDGKMTSSNIVRLSMSNDAKPFEVYPNPFTTTFTASFSAGRTAKATMQLVNMKGQLVYSTQVNITKGFNAVQMNNLPDLQSGLYQVIIFNEDLKFVGRVQKL